MYLQNKSNLLTEAGLFLLTENVKKTDVQRKMG